MKSKILVSILTTGILASLLFAFQNCGKAGFDQGEGLEASDEQDLLSSLKDLPFAYDVHLNQFAYMSCPVQGSSSSSGAQFTFKLGGFNNKGTPAEGFISEKGGLALNSKFLEAFENSQSREPLSIQESRLKDVLRLHKYHKDVQPFLSFRSRAETRSYMFETDKKLSTEKAYLLGNLSDPQFIDTFVNHQKESIDYFSGVDGPFPRK
jgi:hypothetical protein